MAESESSSVNNSRNLTAVTSESDINTNQRLTQTLFNGVNYHSWSRDIILALGGKLRLGYINGSITIPAPLTDGYEAWLAKDHQVMS